MAFSVPEHFNRIMTLIRRYADVPMSFADGCLVVLSEQHHGSAIMTLDRDFLTYRRLEREEIPVIMPDSIRTASGPRRSRR